MNEKRISVQATYQYTFPFDDFHIPSSMRTLLSRVASGVREPIETVSLLPTFGPENFAYLNEKIAVNWIHGLRKLGNQFQ